MTPEMIEFIKDMQNLMEFLIYGVVIIPITIGIFKLIILSRR